MVQGVCATCGLSGAAGVIDSKVEGACEDLMFMNRLRGSDSTGVAGIPRNLKDSVLIAKAIGDPTWVMDTKNYEKIDRMSKRVLLTHNRSATIGDKSDIRFAHPYQMKNIVGMHNGTVALYYTKELPGCEDFKSDSHAILHSIDQNGVPETISELFGAWALVWYDVRDNTLNFLRNTDRPLHYGFDATHQSILFSSEVEMLASAINRNNISRKEKSFLVTADTHYKFTIPDYGKPFEEPIRNIVKGKVYQSTGGSTTGNSNFPTATSGGYTGGANSERSAKKTFDFKDDRTYASDTARVKNTIPHKVITTERTIGKDKYPMVYRDDSLRIYYNFETKKYERYWWDKTHQHYMFFEITGMPMELQGIDAEELIREGRVHVGCPFGDDLQKGPSTNLDDRVEEVTRWKGTRTVVKRVKTPSEKEPWVVYHWEQDQKRWSRVSGAFPPMCLPDTLLDVRANHAFRWKGKKKRKSPVYLGFNKKQLSRTEFNQKTESGCSSCGRTPKWTDGRWGGVRVHFFTGNDFLCEWCAEDTQLIDDLKKYGKIGMIRSEVSGLTDVYDTTANPSIN